VIVTARRIVREVREELAVDSRLAVYEIEVFEEDGALVVYGATSVPAAAEMLHGRLATIESDLAVRDEVVRLPHLEPGEPAHALVTSAIAPMLAGPLISEPHVSQVPLGHRLTILRVHRRWFHCRCVDGYLGWVHRGYVQPVDEVVARGWELGAPGVPCLSLGAEVVGGASIGGPDDVIARLPWGAHFALDGSTVILPDERRGRLRGEAVRFDEIAWRFPLEGQSVVSTAERWLGAPYLWGGTTPGGVDCSGFVQTVFRTHGLDLPRDSDHQVLEGETLDPPDDFSALRPGDLLYFAERDDRISHVAISLGGSRIIHSAVGNGGVARDDLDGEGSYGRELRSVLVAARRVINPER
jgi:gamma-D-glutamyl-L-lysine dipeptidyl-peptidase